MFSKTRADLLGNNCCINVALIIDMGMGRKDYFLLNDKCKLSFRGDFIFILYISNYHLKITLNSIVHNKGAQDLR